LLSPSPALTPPAFIRGRPEADRLLPEGSYFASFFLLPVKKTKATTVINAATSTQDITVTGGHTAAIMINSVMKLKSTPKARARRTLIGETFRSSLP